MKLKVTRTDVWMATIEDRAGGTAEKLEPLANAGANLEFVLVHRIPEHAGKGIAFIAPVKGAKVTKAAREAGFEKPVNISKVRIEGPDQPGLGAKITRAVGDASISFRGLSGTVFGRKFVAYLTLDSPIDAAKATRVLKRLR
jgi:hypothetical protein